MPATESSTRMVERSSGGMRGLNNTENLSFSKRREWRSRTHMRAYFCDRYEIPLPPGHRFPMPKYRLLRERLLSEGVLSAAELEESAPIGQAELRLAHTPDYVEAVFSGSLSEADERRLGFPWSPGLVTRSCASVFGTVAAARA